MRIVGEVLRDVPVPGKGDSPHRVKPVPELGPEGRESTADPARLDEDHDEEGGGSGGEEESEATAEDG